MAQITAKEPPFSYPVEPWTGILPAEICEHILSFVKPKDAFVPASACKTFYLLLQKHKVLNRVGNPARLEWLTNINPYCNSIEGARFVITSRRISSTDEDLAKISLLICNSAMQNGHYEVYLYASAIAQENNKLNIPDLVANKHYSFVESLFMDGFRLSNCKSSSVYASITSIIKSKNFQLIESMIKFDPATRSFITIEYAIKSLDLTILNAVITSINNAGGWIITEKNRWYYETELPEYMRVTDFISAYMENKLVRDNSFKSLVYQHSQYDSIINVINFMCDKYGYVFTTSLPTSIAWDKMENFRLLDTLIKRGCPVSQ